MSKEKEVITVSGETRLISKCRKFDSGYYAIGDLKVERSGDCYFIGNKYFRVETGQVLYDNEIGQHVLKNDNLAHGVVNFQNKIAIFGHFSINKAKNCVLVLENGNSVILIDYDLISSQKQFRERLSDGKFYHISILSASKFNQIITPSSGYKTSLPYDSGAVLPDYVKKYQDLDVEITKNVSDFACVLKDLSFGLEFETIAGFLPERILDKTGLIPLRDGSIPGIEYVTVPMTGEKGLQTVINAVKELETRTLYDDTCALHMHIGNVPRTPQFILAMLKVTCALQDEMYTMFPLYKKYNFGVKNKNYSKPYPVFELISQLDCVINDSNIDANFNVLYSYLSMGESYYDRDCSLKNVQTHPADRDARSKWNITTRYYLNNLIPLIFGNKQTVEFRIHTATLDVSKIVPFMLTNAAIINFTIENTANILKDPSFLTNRRSANIFTIVSNQIKSSKVRSNHARDTLINVLQGYFQHRKEKTLSNNKSGNIIGNEDKIQGPRGIDWYFTKQPIKESILKDMLTFSFENTKSSIDTNTTLIQGRSYFSKLLNEGSLNNDEYNAVSKELEYSYAEKRNVLMQRLQW